MTLTGVRGPAHAQLYFPCLAYLLKRLYRRSKSEKTIESALGTQASGQLSKLHLASQKTRQKAKLLMQHAFMAYLATLVHVPVIVWQVDQLSLIS